MIRKNYTAILSSYSEKEKKVFVLKDKTFSEAASWFYTKLNDLRDSPKTYWYINSISDDSKIDPRKKLT